MKQNWKFTLIWEFLVLRKKTTVISVLGRIFQEMDMDREIKKDEQRLLDVLRGI